MKKLYTFSIIYNYIQISSMLDFLKISCGHIKKFSRSFQEVIILHFHSIILQDKQILLNDIKGLDQNSNQVSFKIKSN